MQTDYREIHETKLQAILIQMLFPSAVGVVYRLEVLLR